MPYTIRLRVDTFTKAVLLAGYRSDYGLAKGMGVNRSTVARVFAGELQPGPAFIGGALTALAPMAFEDLFEVVPVVTGTPDPAATGAEPTGTGAELPGLSARSGTAAASRRGR